MGDIRYQEMLDVAKVLDLTEMTVLDLPDSGLKEMDPRDIEQVVREQIERIQPNVITAYAVHGISGFHDHLVTHAVVKRVFVELREQISYLKRLALITITEESAARSQHFHLSGSKPEEIDCIVEVEDQDIERNHKALDCYITFQETIERSSVKNHIEHQAVFEFFQENYNPPVVDLFEGFIGETSK
mgnify:CR=1 FL=1